METGYLVHTYWDSTGLWKEIPWGELARFQKMNLQTGDIGLSELRVRESTYDKGNRILWSTLTTHSQNGATAKALVAVKLTEVGYISGLSDAQRKTRLTSTLRFSQMLSARSKSMNRSSAKRRSVDAMPVVGGIMTGTVFVWCVQSVIIGGTLWLIYILIKTMNELCAKFGAGRGIEL